MKRRTFLATAAALPLAAAPTRRDQPEGRELTIGLLTDIQYADAAPQGERHYRSSLPKLQQLIPWINAAKPSCTLHLGDLIDREQKNSAPILDLLAGLNHPCHHLLGNHDYAIAEAEKAAVVATLRMPHDYYTLYFPGVRLLMLDSNALSIYKFPADNVHTQESATLLAKMTAEKLPQAVPWGGGLGLPQREWLQRELAAAQAVNDTVILCAHHPLLPNDAHQLWDAAEVLPLIKKFTCVKAWINGHNHDGAYSLQEGIHFVTFHSVLHVPTVNAAALLTIGEKKLRIQGFGREPSRELVFR